MKHTTEHQHRSQHSNWLRAAVLGANDGIISTASLLIGVAAANAAHETILLSGVAGLIAGALSMAAGEYVSVSSQADVEAADLTIERHALATNHASELDELTHIYIERGLTAELAHQVADQLMKHDALGAHARDELGFTEANSAKPLQAAFTSGIAFTAGAALPLTFTIFATPDKIIVTLSIATLFSLALLGALSAKVGGANVVIGIARVTFWGSLAMLATAMIGNLFGVITG
ncbi:MAG: VIT family protein [Betaproteobacteria bacterium]|nr:VIT family protein [Betaproteobacteria bacterium]